MTVSTPKTIFSDFPLISERRLDSLSQHGNAKWPFITTTFHFCQTKISFCQWVWSNPGFYMNHIELIQSPVRLQNQTTRFWPIFDIWIDSTFNWLSFRSFLEKYFCMIIYFPLFEHFCIWKPVVRRRITRLTQMKT